jgi:hypothetical protein
MYKAIIAIGIAMAACLVAGCGSSGNETTTAGMTKAQFIKQASAICTKVQAEGRNARIALEKASGKELGLYAAFKRIVGPTLKQEAEELRSLQAPAKEKAKVARMIANLSKGAAGFVAAGTNTKSAAEWEAFVGEAEAYGLEACRI